MGFHATLKRFMTAAVRGFATADASQAIRKGME
jgi:hypothetical protein